MSLSVYNCSYTKAYIVGGRAPPIRYAHPLAKCVDDNATHSNHRRYAPPVVPMIFGQIGFFGFRSNRVYVFGSIGSVGFHLKIRGDDRIYR